MNGHTDSLETIVRKIDEIIAAGDKFSGAEREKLKNYKKSLGQVWNQYQDRAKAYDMAVSAYNDKRGRTASGNSQKDILDFSLNGPLYRRSITEAMNAWVLYGSKYEVESMLAQIDQLFLRL